MFKIVLLVTVVHATALCWTCAVDELLPGQLAFQEGYYEQAHTETNVRAARYQIKRMAVLSKSSADPGIDVLSDDQDSPTNNERPELQRVEYGRSLLTLRMRHEDEAERDVELARQASDKD